MNVNQAKSTFGEEELLELSKKVKEHENLVKKLKTSFPGLDTFAALFFPLFDCNINYDKSGLFDTCIMKQKKLLKDLIDITNERFEDFGVKISLDLFDRQTGRKTEIK